MTELPPELINTERQELVDRILAKWDAMFYALYETQRPPVAAVEAAEAVFDVKDDS